MSAADSQSESFRVLHCIPTLRPSDGGPARSVPALAAAEAEHGTDVRVWTSEPAAIDVTEYSPAQFLSGPVREVLSGGWIPDIIHDHGIWLPAHHKIAKLAQRLAVPRVVSPRGMLEPWCLQHHGFRKRVAWLLYQRRDLASSTSLHATSQSEAQQFRRLGFTQPITLLPNGVGLPDVAVTERAQQPAYDKREILFLSRIHPVKGLLNLVAAWKNCVHENWRLRIVGDDEGGHRQAVADAISSLELNDSVQVEAAVHSSEKWSLLQRADVVILPSVSENFGIVVAEALAVGTPAITTTGTPWQQLTGMRCGWYVDPSVEGLSSALQSAMSCSREQLHEMGARGQQWVREEFSWNDIGMKMLQAYQCLAGQQQDVAWVRHHDV